MFRQTRKEKMTNDTEYVRYLVTPFCWLWICCYFSDIYDIANDAGKSKSFEHLQGVGKVVAYYYWSALYSDLCRRKRIKKTFWRTLSICHCKEIFQVSAHHCRYSYLWRSRWTNCMNSPSTLLLHTVLKRSKTCLLWLISRIIENTTSTTARFILLFDHISVKPVIAISVRYESNKLCEKY